MIRDRWFRTVPTDRYSLAAMSLDAAPCAAMRSTSSSRGVRGLSAEVSAAMARSESTALRPAATLRMPSARCSGATSVLRNPRAPAEKARLTCPGLGCPDSRSTLQRGARSLRRAAADRPSTSGRSTSITATSGSSSRAAGTMYSPDATSAITVRSFSAFSDATSPRRTSGRCSATRMRIKGLLVWPGNRTGKFRLNRFISHGVCMIAYRQCSLPTRSTARKSLLRLVVE